MQSHVSQLTSNSLVTALYYVLGHVTQAKRTGTCTYYIGCIILLLFICQCERTSFSNVKLRLINCHILKCGTKKQIRHGSQSNRCRYGSARKVSFIRRQAINQRLLFRSSWSLFIFSITPGSSGLIFCFIFSAMTISQLLLFAVFVQQPLASSRRVWFVIRWNLKQLVLMNGRLFNSEKIPGQSNHTTTFEWDFWTSTHWKTAVEWKNLGEKLISELVSSDMPMLEVENVTFLAAQLCTCRGKWLSHLKVFSIIAFSTLSLVALSSMEPLIH